MHRTASALVRESQHQTKHIKGVKNQEGGSREGGGREGRRERKGKGELI